MASLEPRSPATPASSGATMEMKPSRGRSSTTKQWSALLRRKELLLKTRCACGSSCCSPCCVLIIGLILPVLLCALLILGTEVAEKTEVDAKQFAPQSVNESLAMLTGYYDPPTAIAPLPVFLWHAAGRRRAPFDGTHLYVTPNSKDARRVMKWIFEQKLSYPWTALTEACIPQLKLYEDGDIVGWEGCDMEEEEKFKVVYVETDDGLDTLAKDQAPIWAAVSFKSIPPTQSEGTLEFSLRFNFTKLPPTDRLFDRFPSGRSELYEDYYTTGFLSLQLALNQYSLAAASDDDVVPPLAYGIAFPTRKYETNTFFVFAGNLVGWVVIFSFLIPISTTVRAIIVEKESKLREQLLTMGATHIAYWGSVLTTYGLIFLITAFICAVELAPFVFPNSSPGLVAALFILFAIASLAFTFALTPFFRNARVAALAGPGIFFLSSLFYFLFLDRGELTEDRAGAKWAVSIFPAMAFFLGVSLMTSYEKTELGVQWSNAFTSGGDYGVGQSIIMLLVDIFFWLFVAWYLDQVVPSEYGLQRPFYFLCTPSYWGCGKRDASKGGDKEVGLLEDAGPERPLAVEPCDACTPDRGVATNGLSKKWIRGGKQVVAVSNLTLEMGAGQVTSLLGANGAGKTTTISILTGLIKPSGGSATIDGCSIKTQMNKIRLSLGVCPQLNVLFDTLSPAQHLRLYGSLKGLSGEELASETDRLLEKVTLSEKRDAEAKNLSGGQKRKLCLAISLIGQARTVFLDEPTSGMDPHSRRAIWSLLREQRRGRTFVLTTHFLDEAEILSDRIAIMAEGKLKCVGSPLFLKEHFGTGYVLTITKQHNATFDAKRLIEWVRDYVAGATLETQTALEATLRLPGDDLRAFQQLFSALETELEGLGISDYGATCRTLEDVFLQINSSSLKRLKGNAADEAIDEDDVLPADAPLTEVSAPRSDSGGGGVQQAFRLFGGLYIKRAISFRRDICSSLCLILMPVALVWLALLLFALTNMIGSTDPLLLVPNDVFRTSRPDIPRPVPLLLPKGGKVAEMSQQDRLLDPLDALGWDTSGYSTKVKTNSFPSVAAELSEALAASPSETMPAALAFSRNFNVDVASLLFNSTSMHALPCLVDSLYSTLVQNTSDGKASVSASIHSLPLSNEDKADVDRTITIFVVIIILIPFAFVGGQFVAPLVRERDTGSKQMQFISGVGPISYWVSNWMWDYSIHVFLSVLLLAIFAIQNEEAFTGDGESTGATFLLLLLYGYAAVPLASAASFLFKTPSSGLTVMIGFHFLTGFGFVICRFVLESIEDTKDIAEDLRYFFRLFPAFCLGSGFYSLAVRVIAAEQLEGTGAEPPSVYDWDQIGGDITFLFAVGIFFTLLTLALQYAESNISLQQKVEAIGARMKPGLKTVANKSSLEDNDVIEERRLVDSGQDNHDTALRIEHLRREFGPKVAVADLCVRVARGECFGFLGVNGAGKSTTFSMLTGALVPTSGDARLDDMSILSEQNKIRRLVGYCPQHDALEKLMTARETLRMYAKIKEVESDRIEDEVEALIADLDLTKFADKPSGTYSGGNKRKLCVGIALVGNPQLVLLDEPSSGMDAASKRFLWSIIKRRTAHSCTVLTTHSMEECEVLCGRIGVLVHGTLRCLGPVQRLKSKYGQGYKLDVRFDMALADPEAILHKVQSRINGVELTELEPPLMVLNVSQGSAQLSELFNLLSELKESDHVLECSVTQSTLEQIFIAMASNTDVQKRRSTDVHAVTIEA